MRKIVLLKEIDYKTKDKVSITINNDMDPLQDNVTITFSSIFKRENGEISRVYCKMKTIVFISQKHTIIFSTSCTYGINLQFLISIRIVIP